MSEGEDNTNEHSERKGDKARPWRACDLEEAIDRASRKDPTLTQIVLCGKDIGDTGVSRLVSSLLHNTFVEVLALSDNGISDEGALSLAIMLRRNTHLKFLGLYQNSIGPKGAAYLACTLTRNSSLHTLDLEGNKISNQGAASLAFVLLENTSLRRLVLGNNKIDDVGAASLSSMLRQNRTLMQLHLCLDNVASDPFGDDNEVSNVGLKFLASAMEVNKTLTRLTLPSLCFYDISLRNKLDGLLARNKKIIRINVARDCLRRQYDMLSADGLVDAVVDLSEDEKKSGIAHSVLFSVLQEIPEVMNHSFFSGAE